MPLKRQVKRGKKANDVCLRGRATSPSDLVKLRSDAHNSGQQVSRAQRWIPSEEFYYKANESLRFPRLLRLGLQFCEHDVT